MKIHPVFHISLLEPYKQSNIPGRTQEPPPPLVIINDELEYEVEEMLDYKISRRKLSYLIKWKGYPDIHNCWEPAENLRNTPLLIQHFHSHYSSKPGPT